MSTVEKAIWYIENNYRKPVPLDTLAAVAGVSRYHLSRIFCYTVGLPISRYLRLRRLSEAAAALAAGEPDILNLALSLGYGSHEAFSRAFKEHFSRTPEAVREQGHTENLTLTEAISMARTNTTTVTQPRLETLDRLRLIGISRHYPFEKVAEIPDQWQSLVSQIQRVSPDSKPVTYGVIYNSDDESFDYHTGIEARSGTDTPEGLVRLEIEPRSYLVFQHPGHVATVRDTCNAIWSDWLPESDFSAVEAPWFEKYGETFDPVTGAGGLEIWIPVST